MVPVGGLTQAKKKWLILFVLLAVPVAVVFALFRSGFVSLNTSSGDGDKTVDPRILTSLPYTSHVVEPEARKAKSGVTYYDERSSYPGFNLYCNHYEMGMGAFLVDMSGEVVHRWEHSDDKYWKLVTMDEKGNIYAVLFQKPVYQMVKMDWDSKVLFDLPGAFHHDLQFLDDGSIVTLKYNRESIRHKERRVQITNDHLTIISPDGQIVKEVSLYDIVKDEDYVKQILDYKKMKLAKRYSSFDLLHSNTCDVVKWDFPDFCKKGDILICLRNLNLVFTYDYVSEEVEWMYRGEQIWEHPHEPKFLENGNLLIFDNGYKRGWSRVIELDRFSKRIVWEYKTDPPDAFFTEERGSIQRFPNGNTLITESDTGRVFEITSDGRIVWEWYNPHFGEKGRAIVFKMRRFEPDLVNAWMKGSGTP